MQVPWSSTEASAEASTQWNQQPPRRFALARRTPTRERESPNAALRSPGGSLAPESPRLARPAPASLVDPVFDGLDLDGDGLSFEDGIGFGCAQGTPESIFSPALMQWSSLPFNIHESLQACNLLLLEQECHSDCQSSIG